MPFLVQLEIAKTDKYEKGGHMLVSRQDIPAGTKMWCFECKEGEEAVPVINSTEPRVELDCNKVHDENSIVQIPEERLKRVLWNGYPHPLAKKFIELNDGGQYTNHSNNPNCGGEWAVRPEDEASWTIRDVKSGEEINDDYGVFHDSMVPWVDELMKKYAPDRHEFESSFVKPLEIGEFTQIQTK